LSEGAPHDDLQVVRTAGIVLTTLGLISIAITLVWNALGEPPPPGSLAKLTGEVVDRGLITVPTRTSIERWLALDVVSDGESVRWVLPEYAEPLEAKLDTVAIGARVEGRALAEEKLLRWHDAPVRVLWALSLGESDVISEDDVDAAVQAARHQSPLAGGMTLVTGLLLWGLGSLRRRALARA